jgi:alternate signal-mediated exported protein
MASPGERSNAAASAARDHRQPIKESETTMQKSTKSAAAAAAAGLLLIGGTGSLAYWNATGSMNGGGVQSGKLALTNPGPQSWTINGKPMTDDFIVPGDTVVFTGTYQVEAVGSNLQASVGVAGASGTGDLAPFVVEAVDATIDGDAVAEVTSADDGKTISVTATVDFPFGTDVDNESQGKKLDLSSVAVTLTQTDATP